MGNASTNCWNQPSHQKPQPKKVNVARQEADLLTIKNHPNRFRRRSSIAPSTPRIKEDQILEDLCMTTGVEPDVPADEMNKNDVKHLIRKISMTDTFMQQFSSEQDFLARFWKIRDSTSSLETSNKNGNHSKDTQEANTSLENVQSTSR